MTQIPRPFGGINYNAFRAITVDELQPIAQQTLHHAAAIYVGTGGDLALTGTDGVTAIFKNVPSGTLLQIHAIAINAAGTTAADIVVLFRV